MIVLTIVGAGVLYLYYSDGDDEYEGIPTIEPYINDEVGVLIKSDHLDLDDFCYYIERNNSCEIALLIVDDIGKYDLNTFALKTF
ncbi:MAG: TPM domain-containing protein [Euryarchaeota archaeon]|nr:TPM domain-containing protein [Euryarchaeota archaeon]